MLIASSFLSGDLGMISESELSSFSSNYSYREFRAVELFYLFKFISLEAGVKLYISIWKDLKLFVGSAMLCGIY